MLGQIIGHIKCALTPFGVPQGYIAKNKLYMLFYTPLELITTATIAEVTDRSKN